ncbi:MAG: hypothetical protein AABW81_02680 [Nanoarchaeota archaeon]
MTYIFIIPPNALEDYQDWWKKELIPFQKYYQVEKFEKDIEQFLTSLINNPPISKLPLQKKELFKRW